MGDGFPIRENRHTGFGGPSIARQGLGDGAENPAHVPGMVPVAISTGLTRFTRAGGRCWLRVRVDVPCPGPPD